MKENLLKKKVKNLLLNLAKKSFYFKCTPFPSIISNDCFGGEIYRALKIPYNTPFVGLMLMAPCFIKFLKRLDYYLEQELIFVQESKYDNINRLRQKKGYFPIATLGGDVELQFLHFDSEADAKEKWDKRKKRINKDNLFVKFDYSKDLSNNELLKEFLAMGFDRKLAIGSTQSVTAIYKPNQIDIPEYAIDATATFRHSLKFIDYEKLFLYGSLTKPVFFKGFFLSKCLNNTWK